MRTMMHQILPVNQSFPSDRSDTRRPLAKFAPRPIATHVIRQFHSPHLGHLLTTRSAVFIGRVFWLH